MKTIQIIPYQKLRRYSTFFHNRSIKIFNFYFKIVSKVFQKFRRHIKIINWYIIKALYTYN